MKGVLTKTLFVLRKKYKFYYEENIKFERGIFMKKIDMVKILSITGTILGMAGTALSSYASDKNMEKLINEKVIEAIDKINK